MSEARYDFHELIATGGMGEVWRATDTVLGRDVAIKLLKPEYADDPVNRARFDSEARHAAALHHPHVAGVYDVGEMPTASGMMRPYLVMEYVDGKPLSELLRDGRPLDPDAVRELLGQAGDALAAAHRAGIVHRDVKPANLLVTRDRQVKVTDFGIARAQAGSAITGTGQVMGTPQYLSPEQARGERATPASDVYSLGVVAFECLTGTRPFQKESPVATAIAHLHDPVPALPESVPDDLVAVVKQALEKNPKDRYVDAAAFTAALLDTGSEATAVTPAHGEEGATAVLPPAAAAADDEDSPATSVLPPVAPPTPEREERTTDPNREGSGRRSGSMGAVLLVLALVATGLVAWLLLRGGDEEDSPSPQTPTATAQENTGDRPSEGQSQPPAEPETFDIDPGDYIGRDIDEVLTELREMGLSPSSEPAANDGSRQADTVSNVEPTTDLAPGDLVTVTYWGAAPEEPSPTPEPTPTEEPPTEEPNAGSSAPEDPAATQTDTGAPGEEAQ